MKPDPFEIYFEPGGRMTLWYGSRTDRVEIHNWGLMSKRERMYVLESLICRLSPQGDLILTGNIGTSFP